MSHPLRPKWLRWAALAAAFVLVPLLVLHTDWAQGHVLRLALQRFSPEGLIAAGRLDYNILNLRLQIDELELRSPGDPRPYFTAAEVHVDAPWSALWEPRLEQLTLVQPRFHVVIDADGTSNFTGGGNRVEVPLPIDRLDLRDLSVQWENHRYGISLHAHRLDVRIAEAAEDSWLRQPQAAELRRGDWAEEFRLTDGTLGWDGLAGLLRGWQLESTPMTVRANGRIDQLLADRALELEVNTRLELNALARLLPEIAPVEGTIDVDTTIGGTAAAPQIGMRLTAPRLYGAALGMDDIEVQLRWNGILHLDRFSARLASGELSAEGRIGLGAATSELRAQWRAIELSPLLDAITEDGPPWPLATTMAGELTVAWPGLLPEAETTTVDLDVELQRSDSGGLAGTVRAQMKDGDLRVTVDVELPDRATSLQAEISGDALAEPPWLVAIDGTLNARIDLGRFADVMPAARINAGTVLVTGRIAGDLDTPRLTAVLEAEQVRFADDLALAPVDMHAEITADNATWSLTALRATAGGITVAGSLSGDVEPPSFGGTLEATMDSADAYLKLQIAGSADLETLEGQVQVRLPDLGRFALGVAQVVRGMQILSVTGSAAADVKFAGGIDTLGLAGWINADDLTVAGSAPFALRSHFEPAPTGTRITELSLRRPGAEFALSGTVGPGGRSIQLEADVLVDDPAQASGQGWLAPVRRIRATGAIEHDRETRSVVVDLRSLRVDLPQRTLRTTRPARVVWNADGLAVEGLHLAAGKTELKVTGSLPASGARGAIVTRLTGDLGDLDNLVDLAWRRASASGQSAPKATGEFDVQLTLEGNLDNFEPSGFAELRDGQITSAAFGSIQDVAMTVRVDATELRIESLTAAWRGAALSGTATVPMAFLPGTNAYVRPTASAATAHVEIRSLSAAMFADFLPESIASALGGEADATIELAADRPDLEALSGEIRFDTLRLWSGDREVSQLRPTRLVLAGTRLTFVDLEWASHDAAGPSARISGSVDINPSRPYESVLRLHVAATADLSWFNGFVTAVALGGQVHLDTDVHGSPAAPRTSGQVRIENVSLAIREPRLRVSQLNGTLQLVGTRVDTEGISGFANGGDVVLFVNLDLADPLSPTGIAGISGRGVALQAAELRADTNLSLTLSARGEDGATLLGSITVVAGGYRSDGPLRADVLSKTGAARDDGTASETLTFLERLSYDIRVDSAQDLVIDTRDIDVSLALDLQIVGAGTRPGVLGEIRLNEGGEVRLGGNSLIIDRGSVVFADANRISPTLDITATSRIRQYDVTVNLSGDAFSPTLEAHASDGLSQADALSLLTVGRTLEETGGAGGEILAEQAFNIVAGRVGGLGVASSVRFEQAQSADNSRSLAEPDLFPRTTDLAARLTIKRSFGESFDLIYSQGLTKTTDQSWIGVWRLPWNLQLQGGTFDDGARSVQLLHSIKFGRAANDVQRQRRGAEIRVDQVRIVGTPDRPESDLLGLLDLSPGDRFDFIKWRRDVERLERLYRDDSHYEVKVLGRRNSVGRVDPDTGAAAGVVLVYEVVAGAHTLLTIEGHSFSKDAVQNMRRLWQQAVADDFLLQDLTREARRALVAQGYVTAGADATFELDTEPERHIRVKVRPGPRFDTVRMEIEGADTLGADRVRDHLAAAGLQRGTWWDADATERAVQALYREAGFPEIDVEIIEARFEAGQATARLVVREGAARLLQGMTFTGNVAISDGELRAAVAARDGDRLTPASVDAAATAIESWYLRLGYNNVTVGVRQESWNDGIVLALRIQEGPRRILREIEIVGRQRTRRSVLERAIKLRPGDAAVLSELQLIRRRLMDTGALRSASLRLVDLGTADEGEAPAKLIVTVVEKAMFDVSYGVQVLSDTLNDKRRTHPGISAIVAHENFLGIGARVSAMGRFRKDEPFGRAALSFPNLLGLPIETTFVAQKGREEVGSEGALTVRREETRFLGEQRVTFGHLTVGYSYSWERNLNQILELPPDSPFQLPAVNIARLVPTLIWDGRDDAFSPQTGLFHSSTIEIASEALGSELEFWKYSGQQFFFVPIGSAVLATAVRFGTGTSNDPNSTILPRGELFTVGGGTTVRGYPNDSLGRTEFFGSFFAGGNAMLILNQEMRFPIWRWFEGVAFVDAGSSFAEASEIKFSSLAYSTGAGLRLVTPVLSLRLDYGFRLTTIDYLEPATGRLHFGIGHIF